MKGIRGFTVVLIVSSLLLFFTARGDTAELGLKFGSSTITLNDPTTGEEFDVDYDYVVAVYLDLVEIDQYSRSGVGPSFEISYAKKTLGYEWCWYEYDWTNCEEDFTYTGFEGNLKAVFGSSFRGFLYGGVSTNRIAIDYTRRVDNATITSAEKYYWGLQGALGAEYVFNNLALGAEYKYKYYPSDEISHQNFITVNLGYKF